jgi:hypothetical protein
MATVPAGYRIERERGALVVALPSVMQAVRTRIVEHGTLHAAAAATPGVQPLRGRGTAYRVRDEHGDWVVRHYQRGGAVARVLTDEYVRIAGARPRPLRELHASAAARQRGVATPEVLAAVVYPAGPFYRADIATRFIADSAELAELALGAAPDDAARAAAWRAAGLLLCSAFEAGVQHADLNLRNILVSGDGRAWLLDLDRAVVRDAALGAAARRRMLERLHRSRCKLEAVYGRRSAPAELDAFEQGLRGAA